MQQKLAKIQQERRLISGYGFVGSTFYICDRRKWIPKRSSVMVGRSSCSESFPASGRFFFGLVALASLRSDSLEVYLRPNEALESKNVTNRPRVLGNRTSEALKRSRNEPEVISDGSGRGSAPKKPTRQQRNRQIGIEDVKFAAVVQVSSLLNRILNSDRNATYPYLHRRGSTRVARESNVYLCRK